MRTHVNEWMKAPDGFDPAPDAYPVVIISEDTGEMRRMSFVRDFAGPSQHYFCVEPFKRSPRSPSLKQSHKI